MPLIDLRTNLKSLKYGADRLGGGDSGLPYIQTDIDTADPGLKFDDGFVRGGTVNAAQLGLIDTKRISKFFNDKPKGFLFRTKQVGLQLANPRLEIPKNPANIISGIPDNPLAVGTKGLLEPTRIYNLLGTNTLLQIPVNAFGGHFNRHGLLPIQTDASKYEAVVAANNNIGFYNNPSKENRLVTLADKFKLGDRTGNTSVARAAGNIFNTVGNLLSNIPIVSTILNTLTPQDLIIDRYQGGANSVYGAGETLIRRYSFTEDKGKIDQSLSFSRQFAGKTRNLTTGAPETVNYAKGLGDKNDLKSISNYDPETQFIYSDPAEIKKGVNNSVVTYGALKTYTTLRGKIKTELTQNIPGTGEYSATPYKNKNTITTTNPQVDRDPSEPYRYYGKRKVSDNGSISTYNNTEVFFRDDASILTVVFRAINPFTDNTTPERWVFSAYMNGFRDNFTGTWNDVNYNGRAESFYIYNKFKRNISFNLQIPCFNKTQLFEKHRALGQLASTTAGAYNDGLLGGVILKVNVGNYLVGEYATLNSIAYSIPENASWDIADDALLSMYLDVNIDLTIIPNKLPEYIQSGPGVLNNGFFGYLPNPVNTQQQQQAGFVTSENVVKKFVRDSPLPPSTTTTPPPRTEVADVRTTPTLPSSVPSSPIIPTRR